MKPGTALVLGNDRVAMFLVVEPACGVIRVSVGNRLFGGGSESCGMLRCRKSAGCGVDGLIEQCSGIRLGGGENGEGFSPGVGAGSIIPHHQPGESVGQPRG